jgi:kumamolisin
VAIRAKRTTAGRRSDKGRSKAPRAKISSQHVTLKCSYRPPPEGATLLGKPRPLKHLEVTLNLNGPDLPTAGTMARKLKIREFIRRYGCSRADINKVKRVLRGYGLKVLDSYRATRSMRVGGSVRDMEAAFHPNLGRYQIAGYKEFIDREGTYEIPAELDGIVTAVIGFGERRVARRRPMAKRSKQVKGRGGGYSPATLERHYSFPDGDAKGQKIAIAEFGGGYDKSDLKTFCSNHFRATPRVKYVALNAPARTVKQIEKLRRRKQRLDELDSTIEVMMDVEIVAALAPKADITVYFAKFNQAGWIALLDRVIRKRPVALSISWGSTEDGEDWSKAALFAIGERLQMAAALGITVCVAAGDDGSGDEMNDRRAHVDFPGSSPYVLSVGGTMIKRQKSKKVEHVWWEKPGRRVRTKGGSTGGGVSAIFSKPSWQQHIKIKSVNTGNDGGRVMPDVAALAGKPMYNTVIRRKNHAHGGTSASAPLWAALVARINAKLPPDKRQRFLTPLLYLKGRDGRRLGAAGCRSITHGHNISYPKPRIGYRAGPGYDAVTGWGTPIGTALLNALRDG